MNEEWQYYFCCARERMLRASPVCQTWDISPILEGSAISFLERCRFLENLTWNASSQEMSQSQEIFWTQHLCRLLSYEKHLTWEVNGMHSDCWKIFVGTASTSLFVLVIGNDLCAMRKNWIYPGEKGIVSGFDLGKRQTFLSAVSPVIFLAVWNVNGSDFSMMVSQTFPVARKPLDGHDEIMTQIYLDKSWHSTSV